MGGGGGGSLMLPTFQLISNDAEFVDNFTETDKEFVWSRSHAMDWESLQFPPRTDHRHPHSNIGAHYAFEVTALKSQLEEMREVLEKAQATSKPPAMCRSLRYRMQFLAAALVVRMSMNFTTLGHMLDNLTSVSRVKNCKLITVLNFCDTRLPEGSQNRFVSDMMLELKWRPSNLLNAEFFNLVQTKLTLNRVLCFLILGWQRGFCVVQKHLPAQNLSPQGWSLPGHFSLQVHEVIHRFFAALYFRHPFPFFLIAPPALSIDFLSDAKCFPHALTLWPFPQPL